MEFIFYALLVVLIILLVVGSIIVFAIVMALGLIFGVIYAYIRAAITYISSVIENAESVPTKVFMVGVTSLIAIIPLIFIVWFVVAMIMAIAVG